MSIIVLTGVLSRKAGGLFYSVPNLARAISKKKQNVSLMGFRDKFSEVDFGNYEGLSVNTYQTSWPLQKFGHSTDVITKIQDFSPLVIHQQGIWSFLSFYTLRYKRKHPDCKTVIAPRGMLDPWIVKRSPLKKWIVRKWFEDENLYKADCIHALCKSEYDSIREYGLKNPVAIIPNGTNIPDWKRNPNIFFKKPTKTLLFLSRLHPKKGVIEMLKAYSFIKSNRPDIVAKWHLKIGGWGEESFIKEIKNTIEILELSNNVELLGAVYGEAKDELLKSSDALILPTYSEGLPMTVLEAWAYGLPVLTTDYANLPEGFKTKASYRIENEPGKMSKGLTEFLSLSDKDIFRYGENGYSLALGAFSWDAIGKKLISLYDWLLTGKNKPDFIYL